MFISTGETITFQIATGRDGLTSLNIVSAPIVLCPVNNFKSDEKILEYLRNHNVVAQQNLVLVCYRLPASCYETNNNKRR